jgi:EAL domain-containing protein (putative c-di-GMP-specific phosphodiesterase class I)
MSVDLTQVTVRLPNEAAAAVDRLLATVRDRLDVDLVYLSRVTDHFQIVEATSGDATSFGLEPQTWIPLDETYCQRVLDGDLTYLVPDTSTEPITSALPVTEESGIGAYVGVPVRHRDGSLHGTLCGVSRSPQRTLSWRDVRFARVVARVIADELADDDAADQLERAEDVRRLVAAGDLTVRFQPIVRLDGGDLVGVEALARFRDGSSPFPVFGLPSSSAVDHELERVTLDAALAAIQHLPGGAYVSVNLAPAVILEGSIEDLISPREGHRLVIEVTERVPPSEHDDLRTAVEPLLDRGVRLAVDDIGSSFTSLHQALTLSPDILKLDVTLIRDLADDPHQRAVAEAVVALAERLHAEVIAEGIETEEMCDALRMLRVPYGQGHLLGRPAPLQHLVGERPTP